MAWQSALSLVAALLCGAVAVLAVALPRRSFASWVLAVGFCLLAAGNLLAFEADRAAFLSDLVWWRSLCAIVAAPLPGVWLLFSLSFARADARDTLSRWRIPLALAAVLPLVVAIAFRGALFTIPPKWGEFLVSVLPLGRSGWVIHLSAMVLTVIALMNFEVTLRTATGTIRWRTKFMIIGIGSWLAIRLYLESQALLFSAVDLSLEPLDSAAILVAGALVITSLYRGRLLETEIYLSPKLAYNSIALTLAATYLIVVAILARAIDYLGSSEYFSLATFFVFLSIVGLAIASLSDRIRLGLRRFVARNLYAERHDYRRGWTTFTERTASVVDTRDLCAEVAKMVAETFGVASVTLWLHDEARDRVTLGGSTVLSEKEIRRQPSFIDAAAALFRELKEAKVVDLAAPDHPAAVDLGRRYPAFSTSADARYAIALIAARRRVGVMTLSERASKEDLTLEDVELVKTIADQAAGTLLHLDLSQRLVAAKQMEAFQTLSAFFTHDLKNLASTLSLTVQNLPAHFDNPDFRRDALRVISDSVAKMNALSSRLSALNRELEIRKQETDLNDLVARTLADLDGSLHGTLVRDLGSVRKVPADSDQLSKVLVNLLRNASEAIAEGGRIRVATTEKDGFAVLTVADDGCGMSEEFITKSLFQPFQTTKSDGFGIGLFQSRRIVEAHRGRIEVESLPGKGSTFRIELPFG